MKGLKEKTLLYKIRKDRCPDAFAQLYDLYVEKIYRFVLFKISNKEEAEDLVSEIFIKVWNHLIDEDKKQVKNFSGFIYRMARNMIVDVYRSRVRQKEISFENINEYNEFQEVRESVTQKVEMHSDIETLLSHLEKMKQEYQEILLLRYVEEMSIREIAQALGKSQTNVRVTLHRATKLLQNLVQKESL